MPGFDWNGNGKKDPFDTFMEIKVMSDDNDDTEDLEIDDEIDESFDELDEDIDEFDYQPNAYNVTNHGTQNTNVNETTEISFQEKLKKNMRTSEEVLRETESYERNHAMRLAENALEDIKGILLYKVQNAEYETSNGITYVTGCSNKIVYKYLHRRHCDNHNDPGFSYNKYKSWTVYEVESKYIKEYNYFMSALKELALKENIYIEPVLIDRIYGTCPFPYTSDKISFSPQLYIKATTVVSKNKYVDVIHAVEQIKLQKQALAAKEAKEQNEANWSMTGRSILVILEVFITFMICINADIGDLGRALLCFASVFLGIFIICYNGNKK